jgi:hypothetical protein
VIPVQQIPVLTESAPINPLNVSKEKFVLMVSVAHYSQNVEMAFAKTMRIVPFALMIALVVVMLGDAVTVFVSRSWMRIV